MTDKKAKEKETTDPIPIPDGVYVSMAEMGKCRVCEKWTDLRCGACFECSKFVGGQKIEGGHELWDVRNPSNRWKVLVN